MTLAVFILSSSLLWTCILIGALLLGLPTGLLLLLTPLVVSALVVLMLAIHWLLGLVIPLFTRLLG